MKKMIPIDFDGVLSRYDKWNGIDDTGFVIPGAVDMVDRLIEAGYDVTVWTTRMNPEVNKGYQVQQLRKPLAKFLSQEGFNEAISIYDMPGKPIAPLYIDDRAYNHTTNATWFEDEILEILKILEK